MALIITIKVVPASGKIVWVYDKQGRLKLFVKSPAKQGKANKEVIRVIAAVLGVSQTAVSIIRGQMGPTKIIKIDTMCSLATFLHSIGLDLQQTLLG